MVNSRPVVALADESACCCSCWLIRKFLLLASISILVLVRFLIDSPNILFDSGLDIAKLPSTLLGPPDDIVKAKLIDPVDTTAPTTENGNLHGNNSSKIINATAAANMSVENSSLENSSIWPDLPVFVSNMTPAMTDESRPAERRCFGQMLKPVLNKIRIYSSGEIDEYPQNTPPDIYFISSGADVEIRGKAFYMPLLMAPFSNIFRPKRELYLPMSKRTSADVYYRSSYCVPDRENLANLIRKIVEENGFIFAVGFGIYIYEIALTNTIQ